MFAIANPSVVSNVLASYSRNCNFRQYFFAILYLSHPLTSVQNFTVIIPGEPSVWDVKRERGIKIERRHVRLSHLLMCLLLVITAARSSSLQLMTHVEASGFSPLRPLLINASWTASGSVQPHQSVVSSGYLHGLQRSRSPSTVGLQLSFILRSADVPVMCLTFFALRLLCLLLCNVFYFFL